MNVTDSKGQSGSVVNNPKSAKRQLVNCLEPTRRAGFASFVLYDVSYQIWFILQAFSMHLKKVLEASRKKIQHEIADKKLPDVMVLPIANISSYL